MTCFIIKQLKFDRQFKNFHTGNVLQLEMALDLTLQWLTGILCNSIYLFEPIDCFASDEMFEFHLREGMGSCIPLV